MITRVNNIKSRANGKSKSSSQTFYTHIICSYPH